MQHTMMRKMAMLISALVALALLIYGLSLSPLAHAASTDNASGNATSSTSGSAANNASGNGSSSSTGATVPSQCTAIIPTDSSAQQAGLDQLIQPSGDIKDGPDGPDGNPTSFTQAFSFNNSVTQVTASHIADWSAVTAVKVQYKNLVKNATTRVLLPVTASHAPVPISSSADGTDASSSGSASSGDSTTTNASNSSDGSGSNGSSLKGAVLHADNLAGHRYGNATAVSENEARLNLQLDPYIALTSLSYAGGHAGLAWWLVLTLAGSGLQLALAGAALWRMRQAHAVEQVLEN